MRLKEDVFKKYQAVLEEKREKEKELNALLGVIAGLSTELLANEKKWKESVEKVSKHIFHSSFFDGMWTYKSVWLQLNNLQNLREYVQQQEILIVGMHFFPTSSPISQIL